MGGCASRPKEVNADDLPVEKPTSSASVIPKNAGEEPAIEEKTDSGEQKAVENEQKEEPLLVDLSDPKPDAGNAHEYSADQVKSAITELVSEIGGSNPDPSQDLKKDSDDPVNPPKSTHVEKKAAAENESENQAKNEGQESENQAKKDGQEYASQAKNDDQESENLAKNDDQAKDSQTEVAAATEEAKTELSTQKSDVQDEGPLPTSEALEKRDAATFPTSS